jgi:hypothetical protein
MVPLSYNRLPVLLLLLLLPGAFAGCAAGSVAFLYAVSDVNN